MTTEIDSGDRILHDRRIDHILSIDEYNILTVKANSMEYPDIQSTNQIHYENLQ